MLVFDFQTYLSKQNRLRSFLYSQNIVLRICLSKIRDIVVLHVQREKHVRNQRGLWAVRRRRPLRAGAVCWVGRVSRPERKQRAGRPRRNRVKSHYNQESYAVGGETLSRPRVLLGKTIESLCESGVREESHS